MLETIGTRTKNKGEALGKAGTIQEWRDANNAGHGLFDVSISRVSDVSMSFNFQFTVCSMVRCIFSTVR